MSRPLGSAAELERRRRRAVELYEQGEPAPLIGRILGVNANSVYCWHRQAQQPPGLEARPHPGPEPGLSDEQLQQLEGLLLEGAEAYGWPDRLWTAERVAKLIRRHFGIDYHPEHVRKILKRHLGWTSQKPQVRAREQNDKEVERWKDDDFRRIAREAWQRSASLIFLDESGFMLTPLVRRTLAPRGQTPVLPAWERHDRLSAISSIALRPNGERPELHFELLPAGVNVRAEDVVAYLRELRRELPGPWTVLWDRNNIHSRARLVKAWLATEPEVVLEDLPAYAPALNPDEMVWGWLKYGRLCNLAPQNVAELRDHLLTELDWAAFDGELLAGFFNHAGLGIRL
jgi:transposase